MTKDNVCHALDMQQSVHYNQDRRKGADTVRKVLLGLVLALLWPALTLAAPATPYDAGLMLRYQTLTGTQRTLFDLLYDAAAAGQEEITLPAYTAYDDAIIAMNALMEDCPELCALGRSYGVTYYQSMPERAKSVTLNYVLSLETQQTLLAKAKEIAGHAEGDAYTREVYLYDALCDAATYDLSSDAQTTAYGALIEGRAGCEGYARAMVLLCRLAGIPAGLVTGTAQPDQAQQPERHAWCIMSIGGVLTQSDPTWDDQEQLGRVYWYLNLTDEQMGADHWPDEGQILPACTDASASWHAKNDWLVTESNRDDVIGRALQQLGHEKAAVNLRFEAEDEAAAFVEQLAERMQIYQAEHPECTFSGYQVAIAVSQGCVLILPES